MTDTQLSNENAPTGMPSIRPIGGKASEKIDPVTALQEGIDGLSLAMFEALRGLRDAVAPESGNLGNVNNNNHNNTNGTDGGTSTTTEPDIEELWQAYCRGDEGVLDMIQKFHASINNNVGMKVIQKRSDFAAIYSRMEREKDKELVERLAAAVLLKSDQIEEALQFIPGLTRTRTEQLKYTEELIAANSTAAADLEEVYKLAVSRRNACRQFVCNHTSVALDIEEEED